MKKNLLSLLLSCFIVSLFAQEGPTIVSKDPSNRNVVLEEYTGVRCGWCPVAHKTAFELVTKYPDRFFSIAIHQGGYADATPDYRTDYGDPLMDMAGPTNGYPTGSVNRQKVSGISHSGQYLCGSNTWETAYNKIKVEASCVNVAAKGTIDWNTRKLSLLVEVYYTSPSSQTTNRLNVVMLQNNVLGPQAGMQLNSEMIEGDMYWHQHMLRDLITGQWGETISPTTANSFWKKTYNYNIPIHIRNVEVALEDVEFLVFVSENEKTIITASKATIEHLNLPEVDARITLLKEKMVYNCSGDAGTYLAIKNLGSSTLSSVELTYNVDGENPNTFVWNNRTIPTMATDTIYLPVFQVQINKEQTLNVNIKKVNGQPIDAMQKSIHILKEVPDGDVGMIFTLATDRYASQSSFKIYRPDGSILTQGGPWDDCSWMCLTPREFDFVPDMVGCYKVEISDSQGDGISMGEGAGYIKIVDNKGNQLWYNNGVFGYQVVVMVVVNEIANVHKITASAGVNGAISPVGKKFYLDGDTARYEFIPKNKYEVKELFIDGILVPGMEKSTSYTFPSVVKDYTINVTFKVATPPVITTSDLPSGKVNVEYNQILTAKGVPPIIWSLVSGSIPDGLTLSPEGILSGVPATKGRYDFTVKATDIIGSASATLDLFIEGLGIFDNPLLDICLFPNPATDKLFITGNYDKLEIISTTGQIITTVFGEPTIDISFLAKGIYFAKFYLNGQTGTSKFVK